MASMADLKVYLTGGGANSSVPDSTGGVVSSTEVISQTASALTTLTGVTIGNALGNTEGDGTLAFTYSTLTLKWTPPGGTSGTAVDVSADGTYFIQGGSNGGAVVVTVVAASLPTSNISNTVTITNESNKMFSDITKDQSDAGRNVYHCFAVKNTGTESKKDVTIWIVSNTPGQDGITIGAAVASPGNGTSTGIDTDTTDETSAPAGVTFSAPTTKATGIVLGDLSGSAGSTHTVCFWVKLAVPAGVDEEELDNAFSIGLSARV